LTGQDIKELQYFLDKLGYNVKNDRINNTFGRETHLAVIAFQKKFEISPADGVVNKLTWAFLNEEFKKLSQEGMREFIVSGVVRKEDGTPVVGKTVIAYNKVLRNKDGFELGRNVTDSNGQYEIPFSIKQLRRQTKFGPNVFVKIDGINGESEVAKAEPPIIYNASTVATIDIIIGKHGEYQGPSEYVQLYNIIDPLRNGKAWKEIVEDKETQDISLLSGQTGCSPQNIALLVIANRIAEENGLSAEILYGFFREGLPSYLPALLCQNQNVQRRVLEMAIRKNIISEKTKDEIKEILDKLKHLIVAQAFKQPNEKERTSIGTLLTSAILSQQFDDIRKRAMIEKFLTTYVQILIQIHSGHAITWDQNTSG
jgi:peptidoglycan hydrolase-like protein with peptidoglycan-binding domain